MGLTNRLNDWAVPWSDLMMVMFMLFLVLFVTQPSETPVGADFQEDAPGTRVEESEFVYRESVLAARESGIGPIDVSLGADRSVRLDLGGRLFFAPGSAELNSQATALLDRLAHVLSGNERSVRVIGHTDDHPIRTERYPSNWELSSARAAAVARHLIRTRTLDPERFRVVGRGMYAPNDPSGTRLGKARNRRVEIVIESGPESAP